MSTTCLISNFNYGQFVGEAVDAALRQTVPFDEIIIVDDGSTDGSRESLTAAYGGHPAVQIVCKDNRGQLSCFNEGFARARGDIVFFLDADDIYEPDYVEQALNVYHRNRCCDFLYCGRRLFGQREEVVLDFPVDRDLGYSVVLTTFLREWIGTVTSCLSMRREVLNKILPLPFVDDWRVRADDCLVFGASLAGARKRYLAQPLVRYRVHGQNHHFGQKSDPSATYRRRLAINSLFDYLQRKLCYNVPRLSDIHHREFCTIESPSFQQLMKYLRVSLRARVSLFRKLACMAEMVRHYSYMRFSGQSEPVEQLAAATSPDEDNSQLLRFPTGQHAVGDQEAEPLPARQRRAA